MKKLLRFLQILTLALLWSSSYAQVPPYCEPAYSTGCTWGDGLTNFQLGTIDEPIPCSGTPAYYHDFTAMSTDVDQGGTVTLTVISGYSMHHVDVWIDFNDNNVFDASELVVDELVCTTTGVPYTADITIPATAPTGPHSLRYRTNWLNAVLDPCVQYSYGNAADFTVNVVSGIPPLDIVTFDDNSQGQVLNNERLCYLLFTMPNCVNYDLSELGANINALSDAGHIKASIYEGTTLLYTSGEIAVTGGVAEYVSISVPPGSLTLEGGSSYKVAFMADPASPARIYFDAGVNVVNNGVATINSTSSSYNIYSGLTYPTFPEPLYYEGASYGAVSAVVKGYVASSGNNTGTDVQSACDSYTWIDGNTYTASNNTATHTLTNAAGCDSLVTLDLTVNYSSAGTDTQVACDSYLWIDGITYTSSNNTATHILSNAVGCDSVVTLDLTVNYSVVETATVLACDSAQVNGTWYYTSQQITENYPGGAANGCDSTVITSLTIYPVFVVGSIADNQSICYNTTPTLLTGVAPTGGEAPYSYQWQSSTDNLNFTDIAGATSLDYQPGNLTGTTYYRMIQNPTSGCAPSLTLTLGTGTTTQGYPYYTFYMDSRTQMLYTAAEIIAAGGSAGEISWIAYDVTSASSQTMNGFNVSMKNTTATTVSSWDDNMTNLIDGTYTVPGTGWQQHTFATPFVWDGVSNLLVSVCFDNNSYTSSSYVSSTYNAGMTRHYHYDGSSTSGCTTTSGSSYDYRPNMQLSLTPTAINSTNTLTVTVFPEFLVGSITDDQTICYNTAPALLTGTAPAGGDTPYTYQWQSSSDNVTFTDITGATSLDYQPGTLAVTTYYRLNQSSASGCGMLTTNAVNITVIPDATCDAGINADICEGDDHTVSGTAASFSSIEWTTSGDGSFGTPNSLTSIYTPGAGDIIAGSVTLSLTANPLSPCSTPALDDLVLTIQQPPTADAGADAAICEDVTHTLTGLATNYQSLLWTSSGDGTFDDPTLIAATYTPGSNDIIAGSVDLTITSIALSPCAVDASDEMTLSIALLPLAYAGEDDTTCLIDSYTLSGMVSNEQSLLWTTAGDGSFDDPTIQNATYTPGANDISTGSVNITLTAYAISPCSVSAIDELVLAFQLLPTSNAGSDGEVCDLGSYQLNGTVTNESYTYWNTEGDGAFDDPFLLNATYTPGPEDIIDGTTRLVLFAFSISPCLPEISDTMDLVINHSATANAGSDATICENGMHTLSGEVSYNNGQVWTTSGDGSFDDPTMLDATYTPGEADIVNGEVDLTLTAFGNADCPGDVSDMVLLYVMLAPQQPSLPDGPTIINLDVTNTSTYTINSVAGADYYHWHLNPIEAGTIEGNDTIGTVYWNADYTGLIAQIFVEVENSYCDPVYSETLEVGLSPVGINNASDNDMEIVISPNPSAGRFLLNIDGATEDIEVVIVNSSGQVIEKLKLINTVNEFVKTIDISSQPTGNYYMNFITSKGKITKKVSINKLFR